MDSELRRAQRSGDRRSVAQRLRLQPGAADFVVTNKVKWDVFESIGNETLTNGHMDPRTATNGILGVRTWGNAIDASASHRPYRLLSPTSIRTNTRSGTGNHQITGTWQGLAWREYPWLTQN